MAKIVVAVLTLLTALVWYATSQAISSSDTVPSSPGYETTVDTGGCDCSGTADYYGDE